MAGIFKYHTLLCSILLHETISTTINEGKFHYLKSIPELSLTIIYALY